MTRAAAVVLLGIAAFLALRAVGGGDGDDEDGARIDPAGEPSRTAGAAPGPAEPRPRGRQRAASASGVESGTTIELVGPPIVVAADAAGWIVIPGGAREIHPGDGVAALVPTDQPLPQHPGIATESPGDAVASPAGRVEPSPLIIAGSGSLAALGRTTPGPRTGYVGRLASPRVAAPYVHVRDDRGVFAARPLDVRDVSDLGEFVEGALREFGATLGDTVVGRALVADGLVERRGETIGVGGGHPRPHPAAGAPLAEWAPEGRPFVRFRDVEAALRFCGEADKLAGRLKAARGDGRSFETLRLALHDLLLPSIWNANPETTRGVGECALILDSLPIGRMDLALVLRVTDTELHDHHTRAGIAYESREDHLWRPADDPWPWLRRRENERARVADVEVIATSVFVRDTITEPGSEPLASNPEWIALRNGAPQVPAEAFIGFAARPAAWGTGFLQTPDREALGSMIARGAAHVVKQWASLDGGFEYGITTPDGDLGPLAEFASVRAVTDAKGAHVECVFRTEAAAERAREILEGAARPLANHGAVCSSNRRELTPLALAERSVHDLAERCFVVMSFKPVCPCGGRYEAHPVTREVDCSAHGSDRRPIADVKAPKALLRDLVREGKTVRFLWPVRW